MAWLSSNLINIVLILGLAAVVGLIIRGMIRDKRAGKSSCGGDCSCCGLCHATSALPGSLDDLKKEKTQ